MSNKIQHRKKYKSGKIIEVLESIRYFDQSNRIKYIFFKLRKINPLKNESIVIYSCQNRPCPS